MPAACSARPCSPSPLMIMMKMNSTRAMEMSYAGGLQREALFSIALVLFIFIMIINGLLNFFLKGGDKDDK